MKKILTVFILIAITLSLTACSKENESFKIPDVFGANYADAQEILKDEGFKVKAIETSVNGISEKLLYPLEKVNKGDVFKIDEYILDNLGNLTKNYDVFYEGDLVSEDKSLVIYYAKEDYVLSKKDNESTNTEAEKDNSTNNELQFKDDSSTKKDELGTEFKAAMDSYEKFMDDYVDFMKKYNNNPADTSILTDYANYMSKYADFVEKFNKWDNEELNSTETAYYIEVQSRVNKKLLEITS